MRKIYLFVLLFVSAYANAQLPTPFSSCGITAYQTVDNPTTFQQLDLLTGITTDIASLPYVNAIGYNSVDNRIYGIKGANPNDQKLIVIGSGGAYSEVNLTGTTTSGRTVVGDVNSLQQLVVILYSVDAATDDPSAYRVLSINVNPSSPNFGYSTDLGVLGNSFGTVPIADWGFYPGSNSMLYGITAAGAIVSLDISQSTLTLTRVTADGFLPNTGGYGAVYFASDGSFYAKRNSTGEIFKISNISGSPTAAFFVTSSIAAYNDGARCSTAPLPVVFGNIQAVVKNGNIEISWSTFSEVENSHFDIEASSNGINFSKVATVNSKALNGNSSQTLDYTYVITTNSSGLLWLVFPAVLALGLLMSKDSRKRKWIGGLMLVLILGLGGYSCKKKSSETVSGGNTKNVYIRIVQVDKDGSKQYSKIVKPIDY